MAVSARWRELQDLFDQVPLDDGAKERLYEEMSRRGRHYHGVGHLAALWRLYRLYSGPAGLANPAIDRLVACAIAYHDSVYDTARADNEERSAELWLRASAGAPLSEDERQWVATTIRATRDHLAYTPHLDAGDAEARRRERARVWVLDLDLTPLGAAPEVFDRNTHELHAECPQMSDQTWREKMLAFRRRFLESPQIYRSPELAAIYEAAARSNLARPLAGPRAGQRSPNPQ